MSVNRINEYVTDVSFIGTSAPVAPQVFDFNFLASHVLLRNDSAVTFRCSLTTVLTTSTCLVVLSSEERFWQGLQGGAGRISLITSASSTAGLSLRIGAWG